MNKFSSRSAKSPLFYWDFCTGAVPGIQSAPITFTSSTWSQRFFKIDKSPFQEVSCLESKKSSVTKLIDPGVPASRGTRQCLPRSFEIAGCPEDPTKSSRLE